MAATIALKEQTKNRMNFETGYLFCHVETHQQNPNFFPIGEGFGFFVFFGKQNESLASIEKRPRPYHKKARQTTVRVP